MTDISDLSIPIISGVPDQAVPLALMHLYEQQTSMGAIIHVTANDRRASELVDTLPFFLPQAEIIYFPAWDVLPYDRISPNPSIITERLQALMAMMQPVDRPRIIITTVAAFSQLLPPKDVLKSHIYQMKTGDQLDRDQLTQWLVEHGYVTSGKAVESGEYALRGSMIDIIPSGEEMGFRLDLFGDEIEHIKQFDPLTQRSGQQVDTLTLLPASEVLLTKTHIEHFRESYRDAFGAISKEDPFYEAISNGARYAGMEHFLPLFYEKLDTLADYTGNAILTMDSNILEVLDDRKMMIDDAYQARCEVDKTPIFGSELYHPLLPDRLYTIHHPEKLFNYQEHYQFSTFSASTPPACGGGKGGEAFQYTTPHLNFTSEGKAQHPFTKLKQLITSDSYQNKKYLLTCFSIGSRERLIEMLTNHNIATVRVESYQQFQVLTPGECAIAALPLTSGVETPDALIISEQQLLGERLIRTKRKKREADFFMAEAATFSEGELVVHKEHGIGRFDALEAITVADAKHDCLKLLYADDDRLFVPVENIDVLSRYGSEDESVELDRLGATHWQARKAKMKERIGIIAEALMKTAAERALKPGVVLESNQQGYAEFCTRFGHVETEDQARSIEAVEHDLLGGKPMDRLICGDVGFGKTEVALRAAYVAVSSNHSSPLGGEQTRPSAKRDGQVVGGENSDIIPPTLRSSSDDLLSATPPQGGSKKYQVAIIVPTTLLARQHYQNFKARFAGFDINIRQLSRMVSAKEAKLVKEGLADGSVDIVIGTHALLAKDIKFKNLGLVIVDEEQRFGVTQKEKLKALKSDVHVLTLTATPIPRTLQLSLAGVRDLSLITTPPVDRLAIRTFVMPFDPVVLREALLREKNRGGGSFIVTPRIQDIGELKARIKQLVPELNVEVAHGQMASGNLDELMNRFYDRKIDALISTTIIESGLDIPHANTIIINRADRFGLAQLYQLRGRVGRSKTRAYAYLLLPGGKTLTRQATKRLEVMQTLDRLGAGFTLASHDMDIRGFGNLVGDEQSGHIREVGVELYQQMLQDEIEKLRNKEIPSPLGGGQEKVPPLAGGFRGETSNNNNASPPPPPASGGADLSPQINLGMSVLIPEDYVADLSLRMGLYRRIGAANLEAELESLAAEMIDRFGPLPKEVEALLTTMRFKQLCKQLYIIKLEAGPKGLVLHFAPLDEARAAKLVEFLSKHPTTMKLRPDQTVFVSDSYKDETDKVHKITTLLNTMLDIFTATSIAKL